jgi:hypothetical protein
MPAVHRDSDSRVCGATTVSAQNKNVFVNNLLWAIDGDPNSDQSGGLVAGTNNVFIGGIAVCNNNDTALPDSLCSTIGGSHCGPNAVGGSDNVFVGD